MDTISGTTSDDTVACTALNPTYVTRESKYIFPMQPLGLRAEGEAGDIHDIVIRNIRTAIATKPILHLPDCRESICGVRCHKPLADMCQRPPATCRLSANTMLLNVLPKRRLLGACVTLARFSLTAAALTTLVACVSTQHAERVPADVPFPVPPARGHYVVVATPGVWADEAWHELTTILRDRYDAACIVAPDRVPEAVLPTLRRIRPRYGKGLADRLYRQGRTVPL